MTGSAVVNNPSQPAIGRPAAVLDVLPDGLVLVDDNGTVVNANTMALALFETPGRPSSGADSSICSRSSTGGRPPAPPTAPPRPPTGPARGCGPGPGG
ncbi:PAS domain-containing protein [Streptomyces globisporus]|uniref:PAS domain-containing protein n=1 Tax=Streptomyces globisporus TaxID=1908 RepID=A0A927GNA6_STRGL|nr:PAS domain-containing protein [Streptomyces globisporus]